MAVKFRIFIVILSIIYLSSCGLFEKEDTKEISFPTDNPESTFISITNNGSEISSFSFSLNDMFFTTLDDIEKYISQKYGNNNDSLFYYAWQFVCDKTYYNISLSMEDWFTSPLLYINSIGFGLCGKQAIVLGEIWKALGYKSRIWGLNGHIVPEVFYNNRWLMLDPSYKVYYLNTNAEISNVEELSENPDYFNNPISHTKDKACNNLLSSEKIINYYITEQDNQLIYEDIQSADIKKLEITLPQYAVFEFPGVFIGNPLTMDSSVIPNYANAVLKIPPSWEGSLKNTLIIAAIKGSGSVMIDKTQYIIGSEELKTKISQQRSFISEITVLQHTDTVSLIYYINPLFCALEKHNKLIITGSNIDKLDIKFKELQDDEILNNHLLKQYFFYENPRMVLLNEDIPFPDNCPLSNMVFESDSDILNAFNVYCKCLTFDNETTNLNIEKLRSVLKNIPETHNKKALYDIMNCVPLNYLFYDISHATEKLLYDTVYKLTKT